MCFSHGVVPKIELKKPSLSRRNVLSGLAAGGAVTSTAGLSGCATNSETGRKQFLAFAPGEAALGDAAAASWSQLKTQTPTSQDPRYTRRLQNIGDRISRGAGRGNQQWDYAVFDTDTLNAFVLPGNRVGFYKGMMDFADNDDQIAGVMGHEVGHVAGSHARERYSLQVASQAAVVGTAVIGGTALNRRCNSVPAAQKQSCLSSANRNTQYLVQAIGLGAQIGLVLPYSRRHESESDLLGANYAYKSGYDPYQSVKLWEKMAANNPNRPPEFLSTHPDPANRAKTLHNYIKRQEDLGSQGFNDIRT
ncbi:MAG: M48 family metallopeptidase [Maricaulaceae bacterium]